MHQYNEKKNSLYLGIKNANLKALRTLIMENNNSEKDLKRRGKWTEESGKISVMPGVFIVTQTKELTKSFEGI